MRWGPSLHRPRNSRDVRGGLPRSADGLCPSACPRSHHAKLLPLVPTQPSPLSEPVPIKSRPPRGTLFVGTWTLPPTLTSWNCCLSHRRWGRALGPPSWSFTLTFGHKGQSSRQRPLGCAVVSHNLFLLVKNMGFPNNAGESGRDAAGVLMVVGRTWLPEPPIMTEEISPPASVNNPDPVSPMPL